jgi:transposase
MEEKQKRKRFDKEFKVSAVKMVLEGSQSLSSVARDLGIADNTLQNWKKKYMESNREPTEDELKIDKAEYKRLLRENRKLREQRDILKKAVAYFSQEEK